MSEVEILGNTYQIGHIKARETFRILKRMGPAVVSALAPLLVRPADIESPAADPQTNGEAVPDVLGISMIEIVMGSVKAVGEMSDANSDYVLDHCLNAVKRRQGTGWQLIRLPGIPGAGEQFMFDDIDRDLALQLRLVYEVLVENLSSFSLAVLTEIWSGTAPTLPVQTAPN